MQTGQCLASNSRHPTTDRCSRHGMLRPHGSSSTGFASVTSQQVCQRPQHAPLQRCHSLLVRQSATGSGAATTQQQQQQQAVAQAEVALQELQQQQWQQEQLKQPPQLPPVGRQEEPAGTSYSSSSRSSGITAVGADASAEASSSGRDLQAAGSAAAVTWSISNAGSLQRLEAVVEQHAPYLNCIHISAAFVQLQRLWPHAVSSSSSSSSSSTSNGSDSTADEDAWLSSPSNGSSSSSSNSNGSSSSSSIWDELATGRRLLSRLQSLALSVVRIDSRFVANVLHSLAVLQSDRGERGAYNSALVNRLCSAAYSLANSMPLQELVTLAWSLARLAVVPAPLLLRRLVSNVLRQVGGGGVAPKAQDLVMLLRALPALHQTPGVVAPYATVHKLAAGAGRVMAAASGHEAAGMLAALGGLQWRAPPAWLQAYWGAVAPKLAGMGWEQLGMTGWALGQLAPLSAAPDAAWLEAWEGVLSQQLVAADADSSSSGSSSDVPLVELVMVLYGWSKALPDQPPSKQLQQLVFSSTQQALRSSSPSSSLSLKQQRHQLQQQRQQQQLQSSSGWRQPMKQQHAAAEEQQSLSSVIQQPAYSSSQQLAAAVSPRLLGELVSAMARWRLLPPRQWLLAYLSAAQQQLQAGSCTVRDLSAVLWGLATLGVRPKTPWLDLALSAAEQQMGVQAQAVQQLQLQRQQRVWQQQRTQEWAQQRQRQQPAASSSPLSLRPGLQEASPHHRSVVERLGAGSQQQLQQYSTTPKRLAVLLWSLHQLQYSPSGTFWDQFWGLSLLLLPSQYNARDLAMTLEAVGHHQQQPPQQWVKAAMQAGAAVHLRERQRPAAAAQRQQQQQQQGLAATSSSSSSERAAATAQQQQRWYSRDVLRMLVGFARLGAVLQPGHTWCAGVLDNAVRPVLQCLSAQDLCQLLWALGCCGYRPAGRALPAWLHTHLAATLAPASSSSSSGEGLFPGLSAEASVQLLVGLRRSRVVMDRRWLGAVLQASLAAAASLPPQVWVQLLAYVASTGLQPPASWTAAVVDVLPDVVASCQLQQQQQEQQAEKVRQQGPMQLLSVLSSLRHMQLVLPQPTLTLLQQALAVAVAEPGLPSELSSKMQQHLDALELLQQQQQGRWCGAAVQQF